MSTKASGVFGYSDVSQLCTKHKHPGCVCVRDRESRVKWSVNPVRQWAAWTPVFGISVCVFDSESLNKLLNSSSDNYAVKVKKKNRGKSCDCGSPGIFYRHDSMDILTAPVPQISTAYYKRRQISCTFQILMRENRTAACTTLYFVL